MAKSILKVLNDQDIQQIQEASLKILQEFGVKIDDEEIRNALVDLGCKIEGNRVKISTNVVDIVVDNVKKHNNLTFTSRIGNTVKINPDTTVTHTAGGLPDIIDLQTGAKRRPLTDDFINTMRLINQLDYPDIPCALVYPDDVPAQINQVKQVELMFRYSKKPIYSPGISSPGEAKYIVKLFKAFEESYKDEIKNPMGNVCVSPESPLNIPRVITDTMKEIIGAGIATSILSAPVGGMTGPLTLAGGLAQVNAEMLAFAAACYVINPETPLFYGSRLFYANMKTGCTIMGLPETGLASAAAAQMAAHNGFLSDVFGLCNTSCTFDVQSGYEKTINGLVPALAGATWISGFGTMASLMVASYEALVIDSEIFSLIKRVLDGITVNDDTLGLNVLQSAIKGGMILAHPHTIKHLRSGELFIPELGFNSVWSDWAKAGSKDIQTVAKERVNELIEKDEIVPLPEDLEKEVNEIMAEAAKELIK